MNLSELGAVLATRTRELESARARAATAEQELADVREAADAEIAELREALNRTQPLLTGHSDAPVDATRIPPCPACGYHVTRKLQC